MFNAHLATPNLVLSHQNICYSIYPVAVVVIVIVVVIGTVVGAYRL